MRADSQIVIDPLDLDDAIYFLSQAGDDADGYVVPRAIALRPAPEGILVVTECGEVEIAGMGKWRRRVCVYGYQLAVLAHKLSDSGQAQLLYTGSMLFLNATGISAWEEPLPTRLEPVGAGWQQMLPGIDPVTEADRLRHRIAQPLRPRVGQLPPSRSGLFRGGWR